MILLDEWTAVPLDLQPLLAEFLKRTFFPNARVTVKLASLEYRSNFAERMEKNNVLGFELSADISSALELDDYYVYDRHPARTVEMFSELAYRHISAEVDAISAAKTICRLRTRSRAPASSSRACSAGMPSRSSFALGKASHATSSTSSRAPSSTLSAVTPSGLT